MNPLFRYRLSHQDSHLGVAYFTPEPVDDMPLNTCLEHVRRAPNDEFMRGHVRPLLAALDEQALLERYENSDATIRALILETILLAPALRHLWPHHENDARLLAAHTPQLFISSMLLHDHAVHAEASSLLADNIFEHIPLSDLQLHVQEAPCPPADLRPSDPGVISASLPPLPPLPRRPVDETCALAMERLYGLGILDGGEMRHQASLAPWGLQRRWRLDRVVHCAGFSYRLEGLMTSYGRGLTVGEARVSLAMEIVERYSSFADIRNMRISGSQQDAPVTVARHSELEGTALNPATLQLEAPYTNQPLHWMEGQYADGSTVLVPVQSVYLFTNLDEKRLYTGIGSTGLASGNTPEEAKVSGLLEVIERDSEAATVHDPSRCFRVCSRTPALTALLAQYAEQGIDPVFEELTSELGVPCYKCFVLLPAGGLVKATGASLSGPRALVSALTETPFPFPAGPASARAEQDLPVRMVEDLPDFSTGSARGDLLLLEAILADQGYRPVYVNLTKRELRLPVYRSIVPGLEIVSDFDQFTRINPRLWRRVLTAMGKA